MTNNINRFIKKNIKPIQTCRTAIILTKDSFDYFKIEFTKKFISSLEQEKDFNSSCSLDIVAFGRYNQSFECNFSHPSLTNMFIDDQQSEEMNETFTKYINENKFSSFAILQDFEISSNMWQLAHLGSKLSLNVNVYYILYGSVVNSTVEMLALLRYMGTHATYLIVMTWFDYYSLIHTYGIEEKRIFYIPYGISIPNSIKSNKSIEILSKYKDEDFLLLSIASNPLNEDYQRFILHFKSIIANVPNLKLLILVQESFQKESIVAKISETVKSVQLEDKISWTNKCLSTDELDAIYKRATAYISLSDKSLITYGSLLNSISYSLPIISTANIFSHDILKNNRLLIVSFNDDNILIKSITEFLSDRIQKKIFSKNDHESVKNWLWNNIAKQYIILFKNIQISNSLVNDPYKNESLLVSTNESVYWNNSGARNFDHQDVFEFLAKNKSKSGIYTIYSDSFLQLNGKLNNKYEIDLIGLKTENHYIVVDRHEGMDEFCFKKENLTYSIDIDYIEQKIIFTSNNIQLKILCLNHQIKIFFLKVNRFLNSFGLISRNNSLPSKWFIPGADIFSHYSEGQRFLFSKIESNVFILPENIFQSFEEKSRKIQLIMDGRFFERSGFASVNRKMFLSLISNKHFLITIKPIDIEVDPNEKDLEPLIVYSFLLRQRSYLRKYQKAISYQFIYTKDKIIIFRNSWPANLEGVSNKKILIHQQPWEFHAIPIDWLRHFQNKVDRLWAPSKYGKDSFIANGIDEKKIDIIPHGVFLEKFNLKLTPFPLSTKKAFKFLSVGGMVSRKGFDVLLNAYNAQFTSKDNVTLIIHAIYGDSSLDSAMKKIKRNSSSPEVINLDYGMPEIDMIRLFQSADVYVSPYRGEGFGLSILEAMAAGLPPIVTKYGPALDFCPDECGYYVDANVTECLTSPCGKMKMFRSETIIQAMWAEPNVQSLSQKMYQAYTDRELLRKKSQICRKHAQDYSWDKIADKIAKKLSQTAL